MKTQALTSSMAYQLCEYFFKRYFSESGADFFAGSHARVWSSVLKFCDSQPVRPQLDSFSCLLNFPCVFASESGFETASLWYVSASLRYSVKKAGLSPTQRPETFSYTGELQWKTQLRSLGLIQF